MRASDFLVGDVYGVFVGHANQRMFIFPRSVMRSWRFFRPWTPDAGPKKRGEETHGKTHWFGWKTLRWKTLAKKTLKPRSFYGIVQVLGWYSSCLFGTTSTSEPWRVERTMPMSNTWVASRTPQVQYELGHTVSHSEFKYIYISHSEFKYIYICLYTYSNLIFQICTCT